MEIFLSAVLGELASRSIDFFISKSSKPTVMVVADRLQRALLRAQVIVDEAMERQITNQVVLQQLDMLRDAMYRGYYILNTFKYQSQINSLQGFCSSNRNTLILEQLQKSLDDLSSRILDVKELAVFLVSYPRLYRQPYSMHLLLGNCMFGRQMESEFVNNFLLHTQPHVSEELEVLPIVGPGKVGKSTLVAHVCKNESVRDYFSEILFLHDHDFIDDNLSTVRGCEIIDQNRVSNSNKDRGSLVVVDKMFYSSCKQHLPSSSKIIITNRSDKITKFGTTQALNLEYLFNEALCIDPDMHPKFAHVAMEIAKMLRTGLIGANIMACLLRENFDMHFWCKVKAFMRGLIQKHVSEFGVEPLVLINQNKPAHLGRMATPSEDFVYCYDYESSSQEEVPKIRFQDVMYGSVKAVGKFDVLGWVSPIPPFYSYVVTCEVRELKSRAAAKRKRSIES
ncbi:hypothetical protein PVAP13_2KG004400 [Panicum virgatum]|uniref:Disease resistance N-terminal domain-containing protein n=1 Tax=Panicum virgatum TaxID=38727 RepID=A0A8T0W2E9_PANVG|nr:hypothetical protein PVAP13_2KG004400 [Panicum virgatum]